MDNKNCTTTWETIKHINTLPYICIPQHKLHQTGLIELTIRLNAKYIVYINPYKPDMNHPACRPSTCWLSMHIVYNIRNIFQTDFEVNNWKLAHFILIPRVISYAA